MPTLNSRRENSLGHFPRHRFAKLVLHSLLEHHRVSGDSHYIAVEYRIVLPQEISLIQAVGHYRDEAAFRLHHAPQIDLADLQALFPGRAARTRRLLHHRD